MSTIITFLTAIINFGHAILAATGVKKTFTLSERSIVVLAVVGMFALALIALCFLYRKTL